jgi:hypothetical protein
VRGASTRDGSPERRTIVLTTREAGECRFGDRKATCHSASIAPCRVAGPCEGNKADGRPIDFDLSGPGVAGDYDAVESSLSSKPQIKMIILRNSPGGDAPTGYHLGELFRQKSLETAVSGFCYSSCSRLFLGGKQRYFTDDYQPEYTQIGLHGHYDSNGRLGERTASRGLDHPLFGRKSRRSLGRAVDQHTPRNGADPFL